MCATEGLGARIHGTLTGMQANRPGSVSAWNDRCAEVTSCAAEKANLGPLEGSRRSGTARRVGFVDDIDAARCDWFIESIMREREMWAFDAACVSSSTSF
jgi:hypothetical protein